jgi:hypothetical protein|uniref:Uncharacterized protein n=1 Tax=uncultured marine virus TaxID=186617 RepID=A0A0F7L7L9_9VIRU|nr:hypothetical protein [uncultured marine virus]
MSNQAKVQTRKVGVAGGFINQMMGNNSTTPVVGEGATILMYSDRSAYEVIEVSKDGNSCVIRKMDTKNIGTSYGDERYTYHSNPNNYTKNLEWSNKKQCWGSVGYSVQIIKALKNKYYKQYGWGSTEILLKENGIESYQHLYEDPNADNYYNQMMIIEGVTKKYKNFNKVSIIFGTMEQYRDPSF